MPQNKKTKLLYALPAIVLSALLAVAIVYAWTEPSAAPPGNNVPAPINVGSDIQNKTGGLNIGGNVGIGTTSPFEKLHVADGSLFLGPNFHDGTYGRAIKIGWEGDPDVHHSIQTTISQGTAANNGMRFYVHGGGAADNQVLGLALTGTGNVGIGTTGPGEQLTLGNVAETDKGIKFQDNNAPDSQYANIIYGSGDNLLKLSNAGNLGMVIKNGGNVGIGTTAPNRKLSVYGDVSIENGSYLRFYDGGTDKWDLVPVAQGDTGFGLFDRVNTAYRIFVKDGGNVGIGTANPSAKLDVAGKIKASGEIEASGISGGAWDQIVNYYECNDSDGGVNYTTAGTVTKMTSQYSDYCVNWAILREYYCNGNGDAASTDYTCYNIGRTYGCRNNACTITCADTTCQAQADAYCGPEYSGPNRGYCTYGSCSYYCAGYAGGP